MKLQGDITRGLVLKNDLFLNETAKASIFHGFLFVYLAKLFGIRIIPVAKSWPKQRHILDIFYFCRC